ncbi:MAG: efflux RND transporter periplasmic adaptor subunit [Anaerolineae bacterium]
MKWFLFFLVLIVAVGGYFGYRSFLAPVTPTPTAEAQFALQTSTSAVVSAEGFVVPGRWAELSFKVPGRVLEVLVKEGDYVRTGQLLARLDNIEARNAVVAAENAVKQAEASVQQAEADVQQAQTGVDRAKAALEVAKAALLSAQAQLAQVKRGPTPEQIAQAVHRLATSTP